MSGIVGIFGFEPRGEGAGDVEKMLAVIKHRGPGGDNLWNENGIRFGFNKLETGHVGIQPVKLDNGVTVILDGVVYNRDDLNRKISDQGIILSHNSDAETVGWLYRLYGEKFLSLINGIFALAIWDGRDKKLFLARDRIGIKPLYYFRGKKFFAFASEIKALLTLDGITADLNSGALVEYCTYQNILTDRTLFSTIKKISPAHYLVVSKRGFQDKKYWLPDFKKFDLGNDRDYQDRFLELLAKGVERTFVPAHSASYLSGGFDSTSVAVMAAKMMDSPLDTFNGYYAEGTAYDESKLAKEVSRRIGSNHHEIGITAADYTRVIEKCVYHLEDPAPGSAPFAYYLLAEKAAKNAKVILTGHGGDELFGGYPAYKVAYFKDLLRKNPLRVGRIFKEVKSWERAKILYFWIYPLFQPDVRLGLYTMFGEGERKKLFQADFLKSVEKEGPSVNPLELLPHGDLDLGDRILYLHLSTYLPALVAIEDKMSMAHGLEARMPICDLEILEFATSIPMRYKIRNGTYKYIEKEAMRPLLPRSLYRQPKRGFPTPFSRWYRKELKNFAREIILESGFLPDEVFNYSYLAKFLDEFSRGKGEGLRDYERATRIYSLITISLLFKTLIK